MKTVFLIGFMGAGKSTIGRELAVRLGKKFVDTDWEAENQAGKAISEIFAEDGEESFRQLETSILKTLIQDNDSVVATGGGIILREENRRLLKENGVVFFLNAAAEEISRRLENDDSRPLLKGKKEIKIIELLSARLRFYEEASHYTIETSGKTPHELADEIETRLTRR